MARRRNSPPIVDVTANLAEYVTSLGRDDVPDEVADRATETIRDQVGVEIAGSGRRDGRRIVDFATATGGGGATILDGTAATPLAAALANGTLGGVLSYDDTFESMVIHPTSPVFPAALAAVEVTDADGTSLLTAYVTGVEVAYRVGLATHPGHYRAGWHSTGTIGSFGATAAAASVLGLTDEELRSAFGIVGSSASSLRKNSGSTTFALHGGHAAQMGLRAAQMAAAGITGDPEIFEGALGYGATMTPDDEFEPSALDPDADDRWGVLDIGLKAYPCARVPQSAMDGLRDLLRREGLDAADVEGVVAEFDPELKGILDYPTPENWIRARGSIEFCLAATLLEGEASVSHFTDEYVGRDRTQAAMRKIEPSYEAPLGEEFSNYGSRVRVRTVAGDDHVIEVEHAPGSPENPMDQERQRRKFLDCTSGTLGQDGAAELHSILGSLEEPGRLDAVLALVREQS